MAAVQSAVLNNVLGGTIRPQVASIAQQLWQTKTIAPLAGIQDIYTQGVQSYTQGLTSAATALQQRINSALSANATSARNGDLDLAASATQQSTLGWTSAGAYYLEIERANAATLSLLTATPVTTGPTWDGLPPAMSYDLAPFESAIASFMRTLQTVVNTTDGLNQPSGSPRTLAAAQADASGVSTLEQIIRELNVNGNTIKTIQGVFRPEQRADLDRPVRRPDDSGPDPHHHRLVGPRARRGVVIGDGEHGRGDLERADLQLGRRSGHGRRAT